MIAMQFIFKRLAAAVFSRRTAGVHGGFNRHRHWTRLVILWTGAASLIALSWLASGCLTTKNPAPINLGWAERQARTDAEKLSQIAQIMRRDLADLSELRQVFQTHSPTLYQPPFPLDLFKYVAVDCFNEPYQAQSASNTASNKEKSTNKNSEGAKKEATEEQKAPEQAEQVEKTQLPGDIQLDCQPEFLGLLVAQLDGSAPERKNEAVEKLMTLDRLRQLRGVLRYRIGQMPAILRESRRIVAARRADLRRTRDTEARRRTEYNSEGWAEVQRSLDELDERLDTLSAEIDAISKVWPDWAPVIDQEISDFYAYLTAISYEDEPPASYEDEPPAISKLF